jgi:hypothetical protein
MPELRPRDSAPCDAHPSPRTACVLTEADRRQLMRHFEACQATRQAGWPLLPYVLQHKIMTAEVLDGPVPPDLATSGCHVVYSVDGGPAQSGLLSHRARPDAAFGVIAVRSLLGATLIGMRIGQRAPLLREDGSIAGLVLHGLAAP